MVRGCAIGARGAVRSIVVVSERPVDELDELMVDLSSRTSVILARLILRARRKGREPRLFGAPPLEAIAGVSGSRGALVIGDPALELEGRFPYSLDLGLAWWEMTGLPFVFAAWCGRPGSLLASDERLLQEAKLVGLARRDASGGEHAARTGLPPATLRAYLHEAHPLRLRRRRAARPPALLRRCGRAGLLPRAQVRFFDEDRCAPVSPAALDSLLARAADGERLSAAEGERLVADASLFDLGLAADAVRKRKHPHGVVTYIVDRNVNYTNVCTTSCRFCAFYRPLGHPEGYVLSREELDEKAAGGRRRRRRADPPARRAAPRACGIELVRGPLPLDKARVRARAPRALARGDSSHRAPGRARRARGARAPARGRASTACQGAAPKSSSTVSAARSRRRNARATSGSA